ncbi:MAG: PD40 domain-containing protein, partial [Planctomycetales bacterium]|nr:PD40 domain-containing protein [Planctomycetales bacterium]
MKTNYLNRRVLYFFHMLLVAVSFNTTLADETASDEPADKSKVWNIEQPSGELTDQTIDVTEGTWINLDISPDGQQIVFDLLGDLYLMPVEVTDQPAEPRKLTSGMAWDMQPRFSPDGQWIAFTSDRTGSSDKAGDNIWIIRSDGSQVRQITNETYRLLNNPAWSPDGQYIVARKHFTSRRSLGAGEIWMYHRAAADAKAMTGLQLTFRPTDQKDVNEPVFSPDGRYVYFSQDDTSGSTFEYDKDSNQEIYVVKRYDRTTGEIENYITGPGGACRPTPSPDGKQIAFVRRIGANSVLHVMDCDSGAIRPVYGPLERDMQEAWAIHGVYPGFAWMPDGQSIVIYGKGKIRRINVDSGEGHDIPFHIRDIRKVASAVRFPIEVAPDECHTKMLRWVQTSPDGSKVVFQSLGYIYVRDLATGEVQRLTAQTDHFEFFPQFSRDGKYVVYTTWNDKNLGSVRIASANAGGDQQSWKVTDSPGHYIEPTFSPDGQHVAFVKARGGYITSPLYARETGLYVASVKGDAIKKLVSGASSPQFADASDRIYFERSNSNKDADNLGLYSIGIDGQEERQHYESTWATNFRLSPDGQWIAFIERFHVYVTPFIQTGQTVQVGPGSSALPVAKVSEEAGDWIHFSGDSRTIHWALGSELFSLPLTDAFAFLSENSHSEHRDESESAAAKKPVSQEIGFAFAHAKPDTTIALVGGKIVTMGPAGTIESGTIVVQGNRIVQVGPQQDITIPEDAQVIPTPGLVILPGLI